MTVNDFAVNVAHLEGKTRQVDIAQIKEILKQINFLTKGILYLVIKLL